MLSPPSSSAPVPELSLTTFDVLLEHIDAFVRRDFPLHQVLAYLRSNRMEPAELERYLHWCPGRYSRNLVHRCGDFELLVLCWDRGQAAPIHGHEGELCWARVEVGCLRFRNYLELERDGARTRLIPTGPAVDGRPGYVDGPADLHSVENLASTGERAVSLHLYARPFEECEIFDTETGTVCRKKLDYDSIGGRPCQ